MSEFASIMLLLKNTYRILNANCIFLLRNSCEGFFKTWEFNHSLCENFTINHIEREALVDHLNFVCKGIVCDALSCFFSYVTEIETNENSHTKKNQEYKTAQNGDAEEKLNINEKTKSTSHNEQKSDTEEGEIVNETKINDDKEIKNQIQFDVDEEIFNSRFGPFIKYGFIKIISKEDVEAIYEKARTQPKAVYFESIKATFSELTKLLKKINESKIFTEEQLKKLESNYKKALNISFSIHKASRIETLSRKNIDFSIQDDLFSLNIK